MKLIDKVALLHIENRQVLSSRSKGKDAWYFPGGKREGSETDAETLVREIREELAVEIDPATMVHYGTFEAQAHGKAEGILVRMTCYTAAFAGTPRPDNEIAELRMITTANVDEVSPVDKLILADLKAKNLID